MKPRHDIAVVVGKFLRKQRLQSGLSQAEVAGRLGLSSTQSISVWERGVRLPSWDKLNQLLKLYQVSRKDFTEVYLRGLEQSLRHLLR